MLPTTLGEMALMLAVLWGIYRLLSPLQRGLERALLALLDSDKAGIVDAELIPRDRKKKE